MSKYTYAERELIKDIIATLTIKRIPEPEILQEVYRLTNKTKSHTYLYRLKESIKKDSYRWYSKMRESQYEYIHQFKECMNEILDLQRQHHEIIKETRNPTIKQVSLAELHRLNITRANYLDVLPSIIGDNASISKTSSTEVKDQQREQQQQQEQIYMV